MPEKWCRVDQAWRHGGRGPHMNSWANFRDGAGAPGQRLLFLQPNRFHRWLLSRGHWWRYQGKTAQIPRILYQVVELPSLEAFKVSLEKSLCNLSLLDVLGVEAGLDDLQRRWNNSPNVNYSLTPWIPPPPGEWLLRPVLHFLFLYQLSTQKPTSHPILWQLSFFTKFNKLYKKLLKGFLKMQEDYYAHTTPFIGILTALPPNASDAALHRSLSNTFPTGCIHLCVPRSHSLYILCIISPGMAASPIALAFC